ncbi:MAG: M48 family metallopeptidase [Betaproteobacteria bacterium]|nr:M48 family metallopeptidase [Betaproteobacteria bacterium]
MSLSGQLFGPGISPTGANATFRAGIFGLNFQDKHSHLPTVNWTEITWRRGGFNDHHMLLEWKGQEGAFSLALAQPAAQQAVLDYLQPARQQAKPKAAGTRAWITGLVTVFVVLPVLAIALLLSQTNRVIDWAVDRIPVEAEKTLGAQSFAQFRASKALEENHPALPMLRELGRRLSKGSVYEYQFHILRDDTVNAFAMPGGYIVFHTGLLKKAGRAEEAAGVLAHEIQHVERRHGLRGLVHAAGWRIALTLLLGDTGGSVAASLAENLGNLRFSRTQETEADLRGVKALTEAGIDPRGMMEFFKKLPKEGTSVPAILSSHPASEARFEAVENALPKDRTFEPLPYDIKKLSTP